MPYREHIPRALGIRLRRRVRPPAAPHKAAPSKPSRRSGRMKPVRYGNRDCLESRLPKIRHQSLAIPSARCTAGTVRASKVLLATSSKKWQAFSLPKSTRRSQSVARSSAAAFLPPSTHSIENFTPLSLLDRPALVLATALISCAHGQGFALFRGQHRSPRPSFRSFGSDHF